MSIPPPSLISSSKGIGIVVISVPPFSQDRNGHRPAGAPNAVILHVAGNAKGLAHEALEAAKQNDFEKANQLMTESNHSLAEAHNVQSD